MILNSYLSSNATDRAVKSFRTGTHRVIEPELTLERIMKLMRVMGITRVANVTGLDSIGIPVVMVCRPNSRGLSVVQGKGLDLSSAKASGIMEAVETYHAERITLPLKLASYDELRFTHEVVDVYALPRPRESLLHPDFPLLWIEGTDLIRKRRIWVPYELVHSNYTRPRVTGSGCFQATTNGLAAGNHPLEAISHGICEVIERDARALWWCSDRTAKQRTWVDLTTIENTDCREILDRYHRAELDVTVWHITSDLGIPCFLCSVATDPGTSSSQIGRFYGAGCHPSKQIALIRALTEAAQSRLTFIAGSRDDLTVYDYESAGARAVTSPARELTSLHSGVDFAQIPTFESDSIDDDVDWELSQLESASIAHVIAVELTKPEFDVHVVRIIIPELEGMHSKRGYTPGRRVRDQSMGRT